MYTLQATLFMYDYANNRLPSSFSQIFPLNREIQESRLTRQSHLFYITRGVSNFSGSLPKYNLPRIWNEWTPKIPEYTSRTHFKINIQKSCCILFRIRQMFQQLLQGLFPCQTWPHWLTHFLFAIYSDLLSAALFCLDRIEATFFL